MRKGKMLRAGMAMGMAAVLAAVPVSAFAESADETEVMAGLEEMLGEYGGAYAGSAVEGGVNVEFGDGLYNLSSENDGLDLSWLRTASAYAKVVPGEESFDGEVDVSLNDNLLCQALASYDNASGTFYLSLPGYFEQAIAINPQEFSKILMSGGSDEDGGFSSMIMQMIVQGGLQITGQLQEFINSIPAETWQEELMTYVTPIMNNIVQENGQETITVGSLSADVTTQTISLPSEKMGEVVSSILTSFSNDKLIESFLQSDAVSGISNLVSMLSGGTLSFSGEEILNLIRTSVDSVAQGDLSGLPGIIMKIMNSEDNNAAGASVSLEMGGQAYDLYTFKLIQDGDKHAFEYIPGAMYLSMIGADAPGGVDILGEGSTAGGMLNHETNVYVNGESVAKLAITDLDLNALTTTGSMIGSFHAEFAGMSLDLHYGVQDDGTRTIQYLINGEVFYDAYMWGQAVDDPSIELIDKDSAVLLDSVKDVTDWIGTFDSEAFMNALAESGIPMEALAG